MTAQLPLVPAPPDPHVPWYVCPLVLVPPWSRAPSAWAPLVNTVPLVRALPCTSASPRAAGSVRLLVPLSVGRVARLSPAGSGSEPAEEQPRLASPRHFQGIRAGLAAPRTGPGSGARDPWARRAERRRVLLGPRLLRGLSPSPLIISFRRKF